MKGSVITNNYNVFIEDKFKQKLLEYMNERYQNDEIEKFSNIEWYDSTDSVVYYDHDGMPLYYGISFLTTASDVSHNAPTSITVFYSADRQQRELAKKYSPNLPNFYMTDTLEDAFTTILFFAASPSDPYPFYFDKETEIAIQNQINQWIITQKQKGRF